MDRPIATRHRNARLARGALLVVLAVAAGLWAVGALGNLIRPHIDSRDLRTATVTRGEAAAVVTASGTVAPASETVLTTALGGRVVRILEREGAVLEAGDPILELDLAEHRSYAARLTEELSQLASRRRELVLDLNEERLELESRLELKELDIEEHRLNLDRQRQLGELGLVAEPEVAAAELSLRRAQIEARQLRQRLQSSRDGASARLEALDSDARILESRLADLEARMEQSSTRAPEPGVVTWVVPDEGMSVAPGEAVARLADLRSFRVNAEVSDVYAARLQAGQPVRVRAADTTLDGILDRVLPAVDGGVVRMEIHLTESDHPVLRSRLRVDVDILTERRDDALVVKRGPGIEGTGSQQLYVVDGDHAVRRHVELGLVGHDRIEIVSGLAAGDVVVISDIRSVRHLASVDIR